jgi:hypothetical protein
MYFVQEVTRFGGASMRVIQMTDVLSDTPTFTNFEIPVDAYQRPPNAVHPGGTIQTFESFVLNADWRANRLVATHHVGTSGLVHARWYEFDTSGDAPTLTQSGEIDQGPGVYTYFEAIAVADNGDLGVTFMESSATENISMYVTGQQAGDPPGNMQTPVVTHVGQNRYGGFRGGDYSGITADPETGNTFWAFSMYKPAVPFWGTGLANFGLISDNRPAPSARPKSGTLDPAQRQTLNATLSRGLVTADALSVDQFLTTTMKDNGARIRPEVSQDSGWDSGSTSKTAAQSPARPRLGVLVPLQDHLPVDDHVFDAFIVLERLGVGGLVDHLVGIK